MNVRSSLVCRDHTHVSDNATPLKGSACFEVLQRLTNPRRCLHFDLGYDGREWSLEPYRLPTVPIRAKHERSRQNRFCPTSTGWLRTESGSRSFSALAIMALCVGGIMQQSAWTIRPWPTVTTARRTPAGAAYCRLEQRPASRLSEPELPLVLRRCDLIANRPDPKKPIVYTDAGRLEHGTHALALRVVRSFLWRMWSVKISTRKFDR